MNEDDPGETPGEVAARIRGHAEGVQSALDKNTEATVTLDAHQAQRLRRAVKWMAVALALIVASNAVSQFKSFVDSGPQLDRTEKAITETNRSLQAQLDRAEAIVEDATFILTEQAVPAIHAMAQQITDLGGEPPNVLLDADSPPFGEQNLEVVAPATNSEPVPTEP